MRLEPQDAESLGARQGGGLCKFSWLINIVYPSPLSFLNRCQFLLRKFDFYPGDHVVDGGLREPSKRHDRLLTAGSETRYQFLLAGIEPAVSTSASYR